MIIVEIKYAATIKKKKKNSQAMPSSFIIVLNYW